jgi:purine-nucleoside phosphorylase
MRARLEAESYSLGAIDWMLVCGSGMGAGIMGPPDEGGLGLEIEWSAPLTELGLPSPSVAGHGSSLIVGRLEGPEGTRRICVQSGRIHPYEGHDAGLCTGALGAVLGGYCDREAAGLVLTCAVGGIDPDLSVGELVVLRDHVNLFGPTPLRGPCFVGMSEAYDQELRSRIALVGRDLASKDGLREAVYAHARGPQYETPAEVAALRALGGSVVGMSTTYEAILAAAHGVPACGIGTVTNVAGAVGLSHDEVQVAADEARAQLGALLVRLLGTSPPRRRASLLEPHTG